MNERKKAEGERLSFNETDFPEPKRKPSQRIGRKGDTLIFPVWVQE